MKEAKNKKGFTLAEVMVVLLVLTILFAACAPFITKRRRSAAGKQEVWMWSSRNYLLGPMDIYYKPVHQDNNYLGGIYIGSTPDSESEIKSSYTPLSKVVIRSGYILGNTIQRQLQLRYGRNNYVDDSSSDSDIGQLAGTFLADGSNLLFGSDYPWLEYKCSDGTYPRGNVGYGYYSMNGIMDANYEATNQACNNEANNTSKVIENNTAFGYNALTSIYPEAKDNTAIGSGAGSSSPAGKQNTFIGYNAGTWAILSSNTLIGHNSQARKGSYNTFVGTNTGNATSDKIGDIDYEYNVALGYEALGSIIQGKYNVAIGSGALGNMTHGYRNVAIGYNACIGIQAMSNKTCIGAWSGPASDSPVLNELNIQNTKTAGSTELDETQITYIGANPNIDSDGKWTAGGKYGGDAVMEIYNSIRSNNKLINSPTINSNTTTVINGNLIVRGRTYFTMGNVLYPFYYDSNGIFGTNPSINCAQNQSTYDFNTTPANCKDLIPIKGTSDRRLKNISSKNFSGLNKIKQLKVYNYVFKNDKNKEKHVGVIAQDLQKIFPNSVFKGDDGYLKIKIDEIFYAVVNSIKELNKRIIALTKQANVFEKEITKMEEENQKLKQKVADLSERINILKNIRK